MTGALPLRAIRPGDSPAARPLTLAEAIALAVPLCFVVEADPLWADLAVDGVLEQHAEAGADEAVSHRIVARWTRTRRWYSYTPYGFALGGGEGPTSETDALEEVARLSEHLGSARRGSGRHPMEGALFSIRGLQADFGRHHAADVLLDAVRQLSACRGTLLVELDDAPHADCPVRGLGVLVRLPATPLVRYEAAVTEAVSAAQRNGWQDPDPASISEVLDGLSSLQALLAARLAGAEAGRLGRDADLLALLRAARGRIAGAMSGTSA